MKKMLQTRNVVTGALIGALIFITTAAQAADPLPSWNDGTAKQSIIDFVAKVTTRARRISCRSPNASPRSTTTARSGASSRCPFNFTSRSTA